MATVELVAAKAAGGKVHWANAATLRSKNGWRKGACLCGCDKPRGLRLPLLIETTAPVTCERCIAVAMAL